MQTVGWRSIDDKTGKPLSGLIFDRALVDPKTGQPFDNQQELVTRDEAEATIEGMKQAGECWAQTAHTHYINMVYYREQLARVGRAIGPDAYTSDDGRVQDEPLAAKVPELVGQMFTAGGRVKRAFKILFGRGR